MDCHKIKIMIHLDDSFFGIKALVLLLCITSHMLGNQEQAIEIRVVKTFTTSQHSQKMKKVVGKATITKILRN